MSRDIVVNNEPNEQGHCCEQRTKCLSLQIAPSIPKSAHITISAPASRVHCSLFLLHVQILCALQHIEQRRRAQHHPTEKTCSTSSNKEDVLNIIPSSTAASEILTLGDKYLPHCMLQCRAYKMMARGTISLARTVSCCPNF